MVRGPHRARAPASPPVVPAPGIGAPVAAGPAFTNVFTLPGLNHRVDVFSVLMDELGARLLQSFLRATAEVELMCKARHPGTGPTPGCHFEQR